MAGQESKAVLVRFGLKRRPLIGVTALYLLFIDLFANGEPSNDRRLRIGSSRGLVWRRSPCSPP